MNTLLAEINQRVYVKCGLKVSKLQAEQESKEYNACSFNLNRSIVISRTAKITPKKVGQFVTFWKRNGTGPIEPFYETDAIDFYVVNLQSKNKLGQFVFPKAILIQKGIISTSKKEGKRAFRVYPSWDVVKSKQAEKTQQWQLNYFYEINDSVNFKKVVALYKNHSDI